MVFMFSLQASKALLRMMSIRVLIAFAICSFTHVAVSCAVGGVPLLWSSEYAFLSWSSVCCVCACA